MDKIEMGKRIAELSDENGYVSLDDFADLVFDKDSPEDVVKKFMEEAPKLKTLQTLWSDIHKSVAIFNASNDTERQQNLANLLITMDKFKQKTKEYSVEEHVRLPDVLENIYHHYKS